MKGQPQIYFHCGMMRTGTTYLQNAVFPHFRGLRYIHKKQYWDTSTIIHETDAAKYLVSYELRMGEQWEEEIATLKKDNPDLPISKQGLTMLAAGVAQQISKMGIPVDMKSDVGVLQQMISFIETKFDSESTSLYATARIWDDGIIDPRDTRRVLRECLSVCKEAEKRKVFPNSFGVARM